MSKFTSAPQYATQCWPTTRQTDRQRIEARISIEMAGQQYRGWTYDIGAGGVGFMCAAPLQVGAEISGTFELAAESPITFRAVIRHSLGFRHGCEFLSISAADHSTVTRSVASYMAEQAARAARTKKPNNFDRVSLNALTIGL